MDNASSRKRPRPVVSCLRCRDKKLKCDRTAPCENCVKASTPNTCTYSQRGTILANTKQVPSQVTLVGNDASFNSLEDLQDRMAKVEELLGIARGHPIQLTEAVEKRVPTTPLPLLGTVVVKGNRSHYHGQNGRVTLLNQFLEVKDFLNTMSNDAQLQAAAKKVKFLQDKSQTRMVTPDAVNNSDFSPALLNLRKYLPPRSYCDRLVSIYFRFFERTMRVLHGPTFMRYYEEIWLSGNPDICSSASIILQLTVVMTMAYHMDDAEPEIDDQAHRAYLRGAAIDLIQAWLDELDRKQRTELSTLQVEVLLLLSRSLRHLYPEMLWSSAGALVRTAMCMGLHMDPTGVSGISPYQIEMRRRLWATILEIDLQASITAGMPVVVPELDSYNLAPANLNDVDFEESSTKLPASRPLNSLTDSLYQICLATSLPQRLKALSLSQRSASPVEAIELGRKVEECLSRKPLELSLHHNTVAPSDEGELLHRVLLDLYIRRPILCLYKPFLLLDQQDHTTFTEIQRHCLTSSIAILTYQDLYTTEALGALTDNPLPQQDFFYRCCKTDMLWAALTVCQHIKLLRRATAADQPLEREVGHDETSLIRTVENTIEHLIARVARKGSDLKNIVFLSLALKWVQLAECAPGRTHALLNLQTRKILATCLERLLQPLAGTHDQNRKPYRCQQPQRSAPPAKRIKTSTTSIPSSDRVMTPVSNPILTPTSLLDLQLPIHLLEDAEQWFGELPDLAAEFTNFQQDMYGENPNDGFNFGMTQDWNWEQI